MKRKPGDGFAWWRGFACAFAALLGVLGAAAPARADAAADISVRLEQQPMFDAAHGYGEYRFQVQNYSKTAPHDVRISIGGNSSVYFGLREVAKTQTIGPDSTMHLSLLFPSLPLSSGEAVIAIDGRTQPNHIPIASRSSGYGYFNYGGNAQPALLVSQGVRSNFVADKDVALPASVASTGGGSITMPSITLVRSSVATSQWSDQWLSYSSYDGVVVSAADWASMPPQVRDALTAYVHIGGVLLVLGSGSLPEAWSKAVASNALARLPDSGLGMMLVADEKSFAASEKSNWQTLMGFVRTTGVPWTASRGVDFSNEFPVVKNSGIPARSMLVLMMVFAVVIGPVNMLFLRKMNRRLWLLWTVPVISFVTSMGVFTFAMFSEGINAKVRTTQFTLLEEGAHRATTLAWLGVYCPLTPGNGMEFDTQTEVMPVLSPMESDSNRTIDWSRTQHLASGWVSARVATYFMLRKSETRRERLTIEPGADATHITVVNGLGGDITSVTVADKDGRLFTGGPIPAGARATLALSDARARPQSLRQVLFTQTWFNATASLTKDPASMVLSPGCFLATLSDTVFLDDGLGHAPARNVLSVVYGVPEGVEATAASLRDETNYRGDRIVE